MLVGISASFHDFGDYGAVGAPRPLARAGVVPVILPRVLDALDVNFGPARRRGARTGSGRASVLDRVAPGLRETAVAPDGVVEAVELEGSPVLAAQWELQEEWRIDERFLGVFRWFASACAERQLAGSHDASTM